MPVKGSALNLGSWGAHGLLVSICRRNCTTLSCSADRIKSERLSFIGGRDRVELLRTPHDAMGEERLMDRVVAALDRLADEYHRFILERAR